MSFRSCRLGTSEFGPKILKFFQLRAMRDRDVDQVPEEHAGEDHRVIAVDQAAPLRAAEQPA